MSKTPEAYESDEPDEMLMGDASTYLSPELRYLNKAAAQERALRLRHDAIALGSLAAGSLLAGVLTRGAWRHLRAA